MNKIVEQRANSDTCGYHAMKFLMDRFNNVLWVDCTGYSDIMKSEKDANKMKKELKEFGYI